MIVAILTVTITVGVFVVVSKKHHPSTKQISVKPNQSPLTTVTTVPLATTTSIPNAIQAINPWRPGVPQLGINLLWYISNHDEPISQIANQAELDMNYLVGLNANSVSINFPFYTSSSTSNTVTAGAGTPSPSQLAIVVQAAVKSGLRVTLRPLMDESDLGINGNWRGSITPSNILQWFSSYEAFLHPYFVMAEADGVSTFIVGTELTTLQGDQEWPVLISKEKSDSHIEIAYSENWDSFHEGYPATPPVNRLGVDDYSPVMVSSDASVEQLVQGWDSYWNTLPHGIDPSKVVIDELGIAAQDGGYQKPYNVDITGQPLNLSIQSNWFTAACQVVKQQGIAGVYFWNVPFDTNQSVESSPTSFVGRPGAQAIKSCFKELGSSS